MKRKREELDQANKEGELSVSTEGLDPVFLNKDEPIVLPKNIKEEIKNNVAELKELLKDDSEFCISLIESIVNVGMGIPQSIDMMTLSHYDDIIKQCTKEHKSWPIQVKQVRNIVDLLTHLVIGDDQIIFDKLQGCEPNSMQKKCDDLGVLCRIEIGVQFNPEVDYYYKLSPEDCQMYETYLAGQFNDEDV